MFQSGRLIGDVFGSIGALVALAGLGLLVAQCVIWLRSGVWHPIQIRMIFNAINVPTPRGPDALPDMSLGVMSLAVGLVMMWIAAEAYERHARSLRGKATLLR
jgi:hypothetical protein